MNFLKFKAYDNLENSLADGLKLEAQGWLTFPAYNTPNYMYKCTHQVFKGIVGNMQHFMHFNADASSYFLDKKCSSLNFYLFMWDVCHDMSLKFFFSAN